MPMLLGVYIPEIYREWVISVDRLEQRNGWQIYGVARPEGNSDPLCVSRFINGYDLNMRRENAEEFMTHVVESFLRSLDDYMRDHLRQRPDARFSRPISDNERNRYATPIPASVRVGIDLARTVDTTIHAMRSISVSSAEAGRALDRASEQIAQTFQAPSFRLDSVIDPARVKSDDTIKEPIEPKRKKSLVGGKLSSAKAPASLDVKPKVRKLRLRNN